MNFLEAIELSQRLGCEVRPVGHSLHRYKAIKEVLCWWRDEDGYWQALGPATISIILGPWERVEEGA